MLNSGWLIALTNGIFYHTEEICEQYAVLIKEHVLSSPESDSPTIKPARPPHLESCLAPPYL